MSKTFLLLTFLSFYISIPVFSKPSNEPEWIFNKNSIFPNEIYISGLGEGKSKEIARNDAIAEISRYFKTNIETTIRSKKTAEAINGESTIFQQLEESITVSSSASLNALQFTNAYHNKKEKIWYCVAYIKREDAWNLILPKIENTKSAFYTLYNNGLKETEPVFRYTFFISAMNNGTEFQDILDFARIINPKNEDNYSHDRETINSVQKLIISENNKCTLFINIQGDYGNILYEVITKVFSDTFFSLVGNETSANYTAIAIVNNNKIGDNPLSITPSIKLEIKSKSGNSIYTNTFNAENKTTAYSFEKAQKKSYSQMSPLIRDELSKALIVIFDKNKK